MTERFQYVNNRSSSSNSLDKQKLMDAEKKSFYARKNANDVLLKYTGRSYEQPDEYSLDERDDGNSHDDNTIEEKDMVYTELADYPFQIPFEKEKESSFIEPKNFECNSEINKRFEENDQIFENYRLDESTKDDIEQIGRCIDHYYRNGTSKISGQFQFKTINSVLAVVKAIDDDSMQSYQSSRQNSIISKRKISPMKKLFSFKKKAITDRVDLESVESKQVDEKNILDLKKTLLSPERTMKYGNLPPKIPQTPVIYIPSPPSSCATASDDDADEIISAVSSMSELSMRSIGEKALWQQPTIISTGELMIPLTICFRKKVPIKKFEVIKRRLSFSKGKF